MIDPWIDPKSRQRKLGFEPVLEIFRYQTECYSIRVEGMITGGIRGQKSRQLVSSNLNAGSLGPCPREAGKCRGHRN